MVSGRIRGLLTLSLLLAAVGVFGTYALVRGASTYFIAPKSVTGSGPTLPAAPAGIPLVPDGSATQGPLSRSSERDSRAGPRQPTVRSAAARAPKSRTDSLFLSANRKANRGAVGAAVAVGSRVSDPNPLKESPSSELSPGPSPQSSSSPPNPPSSSSPSDGATGTSTSPTLKVNVTDPNSQNLTVNFYGKALPSVTPGPNFTIVALPDTQYYSSSSNGGTLAMFNSQTQWIINNRVGQNVVFVIGLGDIVESGNLGGNYWEWSSANSAVSILDDPNATGLQQGIPYSFGVGNHDQGPNGGGGAPNDTAGYNQYFGISRYSGKSYYGGHYGTQNDNHYELFSTSGMDFIVINLAYDVSADPNVLAWANGLLQTYSSRRAIVVSHYLIGDGFNAAWGSQGQATYNALKGNPNLFLMLCGHWTPPEGQRADVFDGDRVYTLMSDYQDSGAGGNGWLRILTFSPASNQIQVQTYSPYINQYETTSAGNFTINYDMQGSGNGYALLGSNTGVPSGTQTTVQLSNLTPGTRYEWYVTVSNSSGTTVGPLWEFTTVGNAPVTLSSTSLNFANQLVGTTSSTQSVLVTNNGSTSLSISSVAASNDFAQANTCGSTVGPGSNCMINVTFTPTTTGSRSGLVTIADSAPGSPQTISLTGMGVAPGVSVSPGSLSFGNQQTGTASAAQSVTLSNTGSTALSISSIVGSAPYAQTNTCGVSVAAGGSCTISVTFTPTVTGAQTGTITITDNASGSPQTVNLTGTGTAVLPPAPAVTLSANSLTFGNPAITVVQDTSATGGGSTTLSAGFGSKVTQNNLMVVGVSSYAGNTFGSPAITDTLGSNWFLAVAQNPGTTGTPSQCNIYYAVVPSTGANTVTVHATGTNNLHLHIYEISGLVTSSVLDQTGSSFQSSATAGTVSTSGPTTMANEYVFSYTGRDNGAGTWTQGAGYGHMLSSPNIGSGADAVSEDKIISATGTQTATATSSAADALTSVIATFRAVGGGITVGTTSAAQSLTLSNTGNAALNITSIMPSGDYADTTTCGATLAAGSNCTINVTFTPTAVGTRTGTIVLTDNTSNSPQVANLTGTGLAGLAVTSLSPTSAAAGTSVTITGTNFGATQGTSTVQFNGTPATPTSWSATNIVVPVPAGATTGNVVVTVSGVASNGMSFTVLAAPSITSLSPTSAAVGASVTISGTSFGATQGTSTVQFNGTPATPTSWNATSIVVPVPAGATTGNVVVTVSGVASNGLAFTVLSTPSITSLNPTSGQIGTSVTISGTNLGATQGTSTVMFNGTVTTPASWSATSIVASVPITTTGNVVITVGGVASNGVNFTVTPPTAPTSLVASVAAPSSTEIDLSFTASTDTGGVTSYLLERCQGAGCSNFVQLPPLPGNIVPFLQETGLAPSTSYSFRLRATDAAGNLSGYSNIASATTPFGATITSGVPTSGPVGTSVTLTGTSFGATQGTSTVTFNGIAATPTSWSNTTITSPVPVGAATGLVYVFLNGVESNPFLFTVTTPPPSIASLNPTSGPVGAPVTITGANFGGTQGTSTVTFNGITAMPTGWSATSIAVPVPAGATTGNVVVTVGGVASNGVTFTATPPPAITSLNPTSGPVGTSITIAGSNFGASQGTSTVTFNGTAATPTFWSATSIVVPVPVGATRGNVVVTVSGVASNGISFIVTPPAPSITSLSPTSGPVGISVTITGANFGTSQGTSTVTFNGTTATFAGWTDSSISVPVPSGATTGNVVVTVGGVASNGIAFTVTPPPAITSLSPVSGPVGTSVTISGANFGASQGTSAVTFNGTSATATSWSATSIVAPVPAGATTGNVVVIVGGVASNGMTFTLPPPPPNIAGLGPNSGPVGGSVTINGANFGALQGTSTVTFNGTSAGSIAPASWSSGSIIAQVPVGASSGNVVVTVGGVASNGVVFTVTPAPSIISLSPTSGPVGTSVTIAGSNFGATQGGSVVTFNGDPASVTNWSGTSITATVPAGAATGNVVVNVSGVTSNGVPFSVVPPPPNISNLNPTFGPIGTSVIITGANFGGPLGTSTVTFNGIAASPTSWIGTTIVAPVPSGATSGNVVVTVGGVASNGVNFTVTTTVPSITSLTPSNGPVGTSVTIAGANFGGSQGTSTVTFNGVSAGPAVFWSTTSITVLVPSGATTGNVVVTLGGVASNGMSFTVLTAPSITSLSPTSAVVGASVTITGTNFGATQGTSTVQFNGTPATPTSWSATSIVARVPAGATTGNVVVAVSGVASNGMSFTVLAVVPKTIAVVQHKSATATGGASLALAFTSNVTSGNVIVVAVSTYSGATISSPTDNSSASNNTYALAVSNNPPITGTPSAASIYYAVANATGPLTITAHISAAHNIHLHIYEISGLSSTLSAVLDQTGASFQTPTTSGIVSTSGATTVANEYVFAFFATDNSIQTWTKGGSYTDLETSNRVGGDSGFSEDLVITSTGKQTATATLTGKDFVTSVIATFRPQ
jgi:hypothetical protein